MNRPICIFPWVHAFSNTEAQRALCCVASVPDQKEELSLKEFWNSDYLKNVRLQMLKGKFPAECQACAHQYNTTTPNKFANELFKQHIEHRVSETNEDGSINLSPLYYDYRFSNLCDLKCKMCNKESSSRHELDYRNRFQITSPTINQSRQHFNHNILMPELKSAILNGEVEHLYWAGGEPFLSPEHWEILNFAIDNNKASSIELSYNTNLNQWNKYSQKFHELSSHFKKIGFDVSIDGINEVGTYIRDGLNWEQFIQSIDEIKENQNIKLGFAITLTIPGALYLDQLLQFIRNHKRGYHLTLAAPLGPTDLLSFAVLPHEIKQELLLKIKRVLQLYPEDFFQPFKEAYHLIEQTPYMAENSPKLLEKIKEAATEYKSKENATISLSKLYAQRSIILANWWDSL